MHELGLKVRDIITNFEGIIVSKTYYLDNSILYGVRALITKNSKGREIEYISNKEVIIDER